MSVERSSLDPEDVYEDIQGEVVPDDIPRRFSIPANRIIHSVGEFKKELRRPDIREVVDKLHDDGRVVAAKHQASEIIFDVAKHRRAIIAGAVTTAGAVGAYHIFRKRNRQ